MFSTLLATLLDFSHALKFALTCNSERQRTLGFTYAADGLVAAMDGPRADVEDATTYNYYAEGNLNGTTNALGQVTAIRAHDARGNPRTMVDVKRDWHRTDLR